MANYFIAVGGVGQNVALAYYKLTKLCGYEPADIYVLDSDLSIARHQTSFMRLEPIPIEPCILQLQRNSFYDLFNPEKDSNIDSMLSVLFTSKELKTPIDEGMFGKPSVGSATILDKIDLMDNDRTPQQSCRLSDVNFSTLLQKLRSPGIHHVVICGSSKGGTGAGGVPTLAQYISSQVDKERVKIIVLYFLRHFNILLAQEKLKYDEIKNEQLRINAESGMCYLADEIAKDVDGCILFGLLEPFDIPYREAQDQVETESFLYLLAAIVGNNLFHANLAKYLPPNSERIYAYWIPYNDSSKISELMLYDLEIYLPNGRAIGLDNIPKLASATMDFLEIFSRYMNPLPKGSFFPSLVVPKKIRTVIDKFINVTQLDKEKALEDIAEELRKYKNSINDNFEWFKCTLRKECDLANERPEATVLSPDNGEKIITVKEEKYRKTKEQPMKFIRNLVKKHVNWGEPRSINDVIRPLVIGIKKSVNCEFLNDIFKDMRFTC